MRTTTNMIYPAFAVLALACFALSPAAKAADAPGAGTGPGVQHRPMTDQSLPNDVRPNPPQSQLPKNSTGYLGLRAISRPLPPRAPQVVLYDQYDNPGFNGTLSATFTDFPNSSSDLADDFIVPAGQTWNVESIDADGSYFPRPGPATDWNVFIYTDNAGLPGTQIFSATNQPLIANGTTFTVALPTAAVLTEGTYWIEIQANMIYGTQGGWYWTDRTVQSGSGAAFRNAGGAFGCGIDWVRKTDCSPTTNPDQVYRLNGISGGGDGTPTPTPTATPTGTPSPTPTPTATPRVTPRPRPTPHPRPVNLASGSLSLTRPSQPRQLTLADRVAYQRAIEEVYWRHRIWPKERPDPKPSLDAVMSQTQIERKVADYLRNSQALADYRQRPITAEQLQTEMDRMAQHTKQPEVLRELFEVLGDDPLVIAECLARPLLAKRIVTNLYAHDQERSDSPLSAKKWTASQTRAEVNNYQLPEIVGGGCVDDTWAATSTTNAPDGRTVHTAVWTGGEMIVWGGYNGTSYVNTGGRYDPATDSWTGTSTINAPEARIAHTAIWTGSEMIVWGGQGNISPFLNTGGRYDPATDSWAPTSTTNAPETRVFHSAIWTGSEMTVWGGIGSLMDVNTGGRYNPDTNSWTATSLVNAPEARDGHTAVWTGGEMIVWGGADFLGNFFNTGGKYNPSSDTWTATSIANAPEARTVHTAVWTGGEMIVWGGADADSNFNTGGRYDPSTDSWTPTSTTNVPDARGQHTAIWTDSEVIVWGGGDDITFFNSGGRYDPATDSWTATSTTNAPEARIYHTAVSSGSEMIVWGGRDDSTRFNTGGKYCTQSGPTPRVTPRPRPIPHPRPTPPR